MATPDVDFVYGDTDTPVNEIAELYSYTEQSEHQLNVQVIIKQLLKFKYLHLVDDSLAIMVNFCRFNDKKIK